MAFIETYPVPGSVPGPGEMLVKLTGWRGERWSVTYDTTRKKFMSGSDQWNDEN